MPYSKFSLTSPHLQYLFTNQLNTILIMEEENIYAQSQNADGLNSPNAGSDIPPKPESYLVWSILSTICCCLPFGIVAIVYSAQVNSNYQAGLYNEAVKSSVNARTWVIASFVTGLVIGIGYMIYGLFAGVAAFAL